MLRRLLYSAFVAAAGMAGMFNGRTLAQAIETPSSIPMVLHGLSSSTPIPDIPNPTALYLPPVGKDLAAHYGLQYLLVQRTTNYHHASVSQTKNIELVARRLNGTIVNPNETFSYFHRIGPYTERNGYHWGRAFVGDRIVPSMGGGVCQGASTLYSALLRTGLPVIERHSHSLTVPYLPPGEDATVSGRQLDFKFRNNRLQPILITAATDSKNRLLTIALWGGAPLPKVSVKHQVIERYSVKTMYRGSKPVSEGHERVVFPGQPGVRVKTWTETQMNQGIIRIDLGVDRYQSSPRVIETGD